MTHLSGDCPVTSCSDTKPDVYFSLSQPGVLCQLSPAHNLYYSSVGQRVLKCEDSDRIKMKLLICVAVLVVPQLECFRIFRHEKGIIYKFNLKMWAWVKSVLIAKHTFGLNKGPLKWLKLMAIFLISCSNNICVSFMILFHS